MKRSLTLTKQERLARIARLWARRSREAYHQVHLLMDEASDEEMDRVVMRSRTLQHTAQRLRELARVSYRSI